MSELVKVEIVNGKPSVTSLQIADVFGKNHNDVLRDIERIVSQVPENFNKRNFALIEREVKVGFGIRKDKVYILSRDGFTMLTMGYTGEKAMKFKVSYIAEFNRMEEELKAREKTALPQDYLSALKALVATEEAKQLAEAKAAIMEPKAKVYDAVVADKNITLRDFARKLDGLNTVLITRSLVNNGILYNSHGMYKVYAKYRDTHFAEKIDYNGKSEIFVLAKGKELVTQLYKSKKLIMKGVK